MAGRVKVVGLIGSGRSIPAGVEIYEIKGGVPVRRIIPLFPLAIVLTLLLSSPPSAAALAIPRLSIDHDEDGDGLNDLEDILEGARKDAANRPVYRSAYYRGGYPPDDEGVCTDVIWRAFRNAGYDLKRTVDEDIRRNPSAYPRVGGHPDPNIDFRRVPNLMSFFTRRASVLTISLIPNDPRNLGEWQGGDIVAFGRPLYHIGIVSDRRRPDGVPYLIHNASPYTAEEDAILSWHANISKIAGHYRWPKP